MAEELHARSRWQPDRVRTSGAASRWNWRAPAADVMVTARGEAAFNTVAAEIAVLGRKAAIHLRTRRQVPSRPPWSRWWSAPCAEHEAGDFLAITNVADERQCRLWAWRGPLSLRSQPNSGRRRMVAEAADSGASGPSLRNDVAHPFRDYSARRSEMMSPGVTGSSAGRIKAPSFGASKGGTGCQQRERRCAKCAKFFG
jgi:hypothetical protein